MWHGYDYCGDTAGPGGSGGGILVLQARAADIAGALEVDGQSATAGAAGSRAYGAGGGAGGSLLLVVESLAISGLVTARGGSGYPPLTCEDRAQCLGGDGAPGRVRLDYLSINGQDFGSAEAQAEMAASFDPLPGHLAQP